MKRSIITVCLLSGLACATNAHAADLPRRGAPAPYYPAAAYPVFTWTGFYAGINGGYGYGAVRDVAGAAYANPDGGTVGGTVGYNMQNGQFVIGLEADANWAGLNNRRNPVFGVATATHLDSFGTIRARAGVSFDRLLVYGTGGFAGGTVTANIADFRFPLGFTANQSVFQLGWTLGLGAEYAITNNLSAKVEYLYTSLGSNTYFQNTPDQTQVGLGLSTIRAGVNYHF